MAADVRQQRDERHEAERQGDPDEDVAQRTAVGARELDLDRIVVDHDHRPGVGPAMRRTIAGVRAPGFGARPREG